MKRSSLKLVVGVWTAVGCVFALVAWVACQHPPTQKQRLPDGRLLELAKVTYGREHRFTEGTFGQQAWRAVVALGEPPPTQPVALNYRRTDSEEPRLWFRWTGKTESLWGGWSAVALDEHGCSFLCKRCGLQPLSELVSDGFESPELKRNVSAASLLSYPRRTGRFRYAQLQGGQFGVGQKVEVEHPPPPTKPAVGPATAARWWRGTRT